MLRHASVKTRQLILFDILSPSLVYPARTYSAQTQPQSKLKKPSFPLQASSTASLFAKLRTNLHASHSPTQSLAHQLPADKIKLFNEIIVNIRRCLDEREPNPLLLEHWRRLDELKLIHLLGHAQLAPLSDLVRRSFLNPARSKAPNGRLRKTVNIDPSIEKLVENIALLAARGDSLDALNALMLYRIKEKDSQAILNLYSKFMSLIGDKNLGMSQNSVVGVTEGDGEGEEGMKDLLATDTELNPSETSVAAGRVHLVLAAVIAHAMRGSFQGALDVYLSTVIELDPSITPAYLQLALGDNSGLRNTIKKYIFKLNTAKLVSRPVVFTKEVTRLGTGRLSDELERLYSNLLQGLSGEDAYIAADPSLVTSTKTVAMTRVTWNALLGAFLKCERRDLAGRLWDDMTRLSHPPGISMWTTLIDSYGQIRAVDDALATWDLMLQQGVEPDALAYRAIISALFRGRRPVQAMEIFKRYQTLAAEKSNPHHLSLYNTVLHGLCASDRAAEGEELRVTMEQQGPKPDIVTYNTFINYYGRRGRFQGVAATLRAMQAAGFNGDVFTYTTILSALLKAGKQDAADLVLALMDKQGIKRNVALYTALIDHQLREGSRENFQAAMQMLQWMEKDPNNAPNEITYTSVLSSLYRIGWLDPEELKRLETSIIERIRRRGISLGLPTYHLLLRACLVYPHENGVQQALAYFEEMKRRDIPIINTTWYILLAGLLNRGEWEVADKMVEEMYRSGIHPTGTLLRLVHKINDRIIAGR